MSSLSSNWARACLKSSCIKKKFFQSCRIRRIAEMCLLANNRWQSTLCRLFASNLPSPQYEATVAHNGPPYNCYNCDIHLRLDRLEVDKVGYRVRRQKWWQQVAIVFGQHIENNNSYRMLSIYAKMLRIPDLNNYKNSFDGPVHCKDWPI